MTKKKGHRAVIIVFIVISIAIIASTVLIATDYIKKLRVTSENEASAADELREKNAELSAELESLNFLKAELEAEIARLESEISTKNEELAALIEQYYSENEIVSLLSDKIKALEEEKTKLQFLTDSYKSMLSSDADYRAELITELMTHLLRNAPMRLVEDAGQENVPEDERTYSEVYPNLSYYYYDLTTGYSVNYDPDKIVYSASLIKALYVYSVFLEIDEFEYNKHNFDSMGNPLYDENGEPLFDGDHPNYDSDGNIIYLEGEEKYDLSRIWVYDEKTMYVDGSSSIKHMADGVELTWEELFDLTLRMSDNIAFKQITDTYGYTSFYNMVGALGLDGPKTGFMNLSANDCAVFLKALYGYFEDGGKYALKMKDSMIKSTHTVMISCCYPSGTVAHKYGCDINAYHDMAIVFDTHPYILVIMTDLDSGGNTVDTYIRSLVDYTKRIHASAYQNAN